MVTIQKLGEILIQIELFFFFFFFTFTYCLSDGSRTLSSDRNPRWYGKDQAAQALMLGGGESELSLSNENSDSSPSKSPSVAWHVGRCNLRLVVGNCESVNWRETAGVWKGAAWLGRSASL